MFLFYYTLSYQFSILTMVQTLFSFSYLLLYIPLVKQNKMLTKVNFESVNKCILFFLNSRRCNAVGPVAVILFLIIIPVFLKSGLLNVSVSLTDW